MKLTIKEKIELSNIIQRQLELIDAEFDMSLENDNLMIIIEDELFDNIEILKQFYKNKNDKYIWMRR